MHWALRILVWVLLPLWLALGVLAICAALIWALLWALLDDERRSGAAVSATLTGLLIGVGLSLPSPWTPWSQSVMDCGVASAGLCVAVFVARLTAPRIASRSVAVALLLTGSAYVIAKGGYVASAAQLGSIATALLVVAAVLPVLYSAAVAKLWRSASTEAASAACRDFLLDVVRTPFSQSVVKGLHTIAFDSSKSKAAFHGFQAATASSQTADASAPRVGVVFLHGYAAGSVYFAFNFDDVIASCARAGAPVFAVDWRGQAASPRVPFTPRTTDETEAWFIESLEQWRVAQGLERMVLIGHRCVRLGTTRKVLTPLCLDPHPF